MRLFRLLAILALMANTVGCGSAPPPTEAPTARDRLGELSEAWFLAQINLKRPPSKAEEVSTRDSFQAVRAVKAGELVVIWSVHLEQGGGEAIVAYDKDAPTQGGWALLQNGKLKKFSAAEFVAAPKAHP